MPYAEERKNVLALANYLGYKTKPTKYSTTYIDLYQLHSPKVEDVLQAEVMNTLNSFKKENACKFLQAFNIQ